MSLNDESASSELGHRLISEFGSPLYVYDLAAVEQRIDELFAVLPRGANLLYSLKANPLPAIVDAACRRVCRAEVSSVGELQVALDAGFAPEHVLYTGPAKTERELRAALQAGVVLFSVESWVDFERLYRNVGPNCTPVQVLLRVNPAMAPRAGLSMAGGSTHFGLVEKQVLSGANRLAAFRDRLHLSGLHLYFGTQIPDCEALAEAFGAAIETAERISAGLDIHFDILDIGGGFPWPYGTPGQGESLAPLRTALDSLSRRRRRTATATLWFESGRYIAASSGTLLATVMDVKRSRQGRDYIILDTGIHHLGGMSGLGRIPRGLSIMPLDVGRPSETKVAVVGPLCSPLDCLAGRAAMPIVKVGDRVQIRNVGAYGLTASLCNFLSHPAPLEIAHRDGSVVSLHQLKGGHRLLDPRGLDCGESIDLPYPADAVCTLTDGRKI